MIGEGGEVEHAPLDVANVIAFTTTRQAGSFGLGSTERVIDVHTRWRKLQDSLVARGIDALASASQVHGATIQHHTAGQWSGWLRGRDADGHLCAQAGLAMAVTIADCTPVFLAHPNGPVAVLHAGWRGTAAGILPACLTELSAMGYSVGELHVHLGPAICGACYEVGPEVLSAIHGRPFSSKGLLDVREVLAAQTRASGVSRISVSKWCTRHDNDRFFSHRAGDEGRQIAVITRVR